MEREIDYHVVVNAEEQYSIWPTDQPLPAGWRDVGFRDTRQRCLEHIKTVWQDMRPLSLRRAMDGGAASEP